MTDRGADILDAIVDGEFDDDLDGVIEAVQIRRNTLNERKRLEFKVGDTVRFNASASPKYLNGVLATVTEKGRGKKVTVELDEHAGRFMAGSPIGAPVAILEVVHDA